MGDPRLLCSSTELGGDGGVSCRPGSFGRAEEAFTFVSRGAGFGGAGVDDVENDGRDRGLVSSLSTWSYRCMFVVVVGEGEGGGEDSCEGLR